MSKFHLILLIHSHQPVGNFDDVLESAYRNSYLPFVELLRKHPAVRVGLHYSGPLLEWFERRHPDFFDLLRELIQREQVELVGGGFYEPILVSIPPEDRHEQITRLSDYLEKHFGRRPAGAWLAERVWEPQLPSTFAKAKVDYTLTDDIHFVAAGFELDHLHGYYVVDDLGATVKVIPGLKALRYLIPYRSPAENIEFLRVAAERHPGGFAAMGDDCEKFGVWPGTYKHCYENGWLEKFFVALEANSDWLAVTPPGEYLAAHPPLGRADLPTASYTEMTEWALPTPARQRFHELQREFEEREDVQRFLHGSFWRNFFSKYSEANLLHKKMLHVSGKVRRLSGSVRRGLPVRQAAEAASTHLLRAQCNDAYWHGVFGGIYAPHLRTVLWRELIRAEKVADAAEQGTPSYADLARIDFDADGRDELYFISDQYAALVKPSGGGTISALDSRACEATLVNSMQRRVEPYHARLRGAGSEARAGVVSIHDQVRVKEAGLENYLRYDRWPRHAFRLLLFPSQATLADYEAIRLGEHAELAAGDYAVAEATPERVKLTCASSVNGGTLSAEKVYSFTRGRQTFTVACDVTLHFDAARAVAVNVGLELVLNLLAADKPDRYFEYDGQHHGLRWAAAVPASRLRLADEWQNMALTIEAPGARHFWVVPIEPVSESEEGFERVYQGSNILAVWPVELRRNEPWSARVALNVGPVR